MLTDLIIVLRSTFLFQKKHLPKQPTGFVGWKKAATVSPFSNPSSDVRNLSLGQSGPREVERWKTESSNQIFCNKHVDYVED